MRSLLACPACRGDLRDEGEFLRCGCAAWPVVEGIPIFAEWARNRPLSLEEALARHRPPPETLFGKVARRLGAGIGPLRDAVSRPDATFLELAAALGRSSDLDYFRYRFSDLSHIVSCALLTLISEGPVLDLGCGAGHATRALARRVPADRIVGLDLNFSLLYLARRFLVPGALFVCADAARPLPFRDGAFRAACCLDTFYFLADRERAAAELLRVSRGPLVLSHLADPAVSSRGAHPPLEPEAYLRMFGARDPRLYVEQELLDRFLETRALDLSRPASSHEAPMALIAGAEPRLHPGADGFVTGTRLNPIYEATEEGSRVHLKRRFITDRYAEVYRRYDRWLPESLTVERSRIDAGDPELARRFVLLDLPPNY